jgi:putative tryptophan/tyrosine transport system substrate-binding protein
VGAQRLRINTFALAAHLPTMFPQREYLEAGGLMSYGANFPDLSRRAADYVDKVLRGAKPADLPVEQPTKFELVINRITARALGLDIPPRCSPSPTRSLNRIGVLHCVSLVMADFVAKGGFAVR